MCIDGPEMAIYDEGGHGAEDADFIANARQDLPAALEIIASLRARVAELEAALEAQQAVVDAARALTETLRWGVDKARGDSTPCGLALDAALEKVRP